jgi:beta-glucan synthesis-associated protein KRE6
MSRLSWKDLCIRHKAGLLLLIVISQCSGGWIDPDTSISEKFVTSFVDKRVYELVFSDEFEKDGRFFHDPKWTAMEKDDYTNYALQYYKSDLVTTSNGFLNISTIVADITYNTNDILAKPGTKGKNTKNYQSAMVNGWNKFCFTGGIVEISAKLPGKHNAGGLWPAMWLLGNMARATYVGSSNNVWPWSYNTCSKEMQSEQKFSACNRVNHYDLHAYQGRGVNRFSFLSFGLELLCMHVDTKSRKLFCYLQAPEIDILEAMGGSSESLPNTNVTKPYFSSSLQVSPFFSLETRNICISCPSPAL